MRAAHRAIAAYQDQVDLDALIRSHSHVIDRCARAVVRKTGIASIYDDLWSAGAMGLVDAAQRFKPSAGKDFTGFVEHRIRGAMLDELRRMDHLPRRLRTQVKGVDKVKQQMQVQLGRDPTVEELAEEMEVTVKEVHRLEKLAEPTVSLDALGGVGARTDEKQDALFLVEDSERKAALKEAITQLPERLALILGLRYQEALSYREIGEMMGISDARVAQLHRRAIDQLREVLTFEGADQ